MGRKKIPTKTEKLLSDLYYNPAAPGSFSGVNALKKAAEKRIAHAMATRLAAIDVIRIAVTESG